jgi:two-component system LytT family sensor kinase
MTFIENVFKYGVSNHEDSQLIIRISAEKNAVVFFTQNRIFPGARKDDRTGIGITNTEKRLQHLYPGKHKLDLRRENGMFTVELFLID